MLLKKIIITILSVLLICMLTVIPYVYLVDNVILKSDFVKNTIDELGVYDDVYDIFMEKSEDKVIGFFDDNKFGSNTGLWFWGNVTQVMEEDYVKGFVKQNADASVEYVVDGVDSLSEFDLMPKYEQLKVVTADNLTMDVVMGVLPNELVVALKFLGIANDEGEINSMIKGLIIETVFETNDEVKDVFSIKTTEELMSFVGFNDYKEKLDVARDKLDEVRGYYSLVLPATVILLLLMLALGIKSFWLSLKSMGLAFTFSALIAVVCGLAIKGSKGAAFKYLDDLAIGYGLTLNNSPIFDVIDLISKEVIKYGMTYLIIGIVLIVFSMLFKKEKDKKAA